MYFDGQLHYLDKDNKSGPKQQQQQQQPQAPLPAPAAAASHARAHTADPSTSSPSQSSALHNNNSPSLSTPAPPTMPNSSLPKSQTVGGTAGDLHSMALKSAINNIGTCPPPSPPGIAPQLTRAAPHFTKRPSLQKRMLSAASPAELLRTTLSPADISFRAITYLPDELLYDIPETGDSALSLFQGFKASLPESSTSTALRKGSKSHSHHRKSSKVAEPLTEPQRLQRERDSLLRDLEIITIRKVVSLYSKC
jgi:hypothetical protein